MNHQLPMNNKTISNSQIQHWDHIPKAKWAPFKKQKSFTDLINNSQTLPQHRSLSVLKRINQRVTSQVKHNQPITPVEDIFNIVADPDILRIGFAQIKNNKGALTPGSTPDTADDFSNERFYNLSRKLKSGLYTWNPIRRIYVEKPGKPEKRPLGLPDFEDKVVQAAIRLALECVYEPIFDKLNCNFGFRPKKDPNQAITKVVGLAQGTYHAIEGDIKGAYNDVNHNILMDQLGTTIQDKRFLNLIRSALKAGIMDQGVYEDTLLGIPQGGIVSPLLFNIYMHTFDLFVHNELPTIISPNPQISKVDPDYERNRSTVRRIRVQLEKLNSIYDVRPEPFFEHVQKFQYLRKIIPNNSTLEEKTNKINALLETYNHDKDRVTLFNWRKSFKTYLLNQLSDQEKSNLLIEFTQSKERALHDADRIRSQTRYLESKPLKLAYIRYADDWVIFTSGDLETATKVKAVAADFLKDKLKLTLSLEKTRITDLQKSKVQFLGFEIYFPTNAHLVKTSKGTTQRYRSLQIFPDVQRLESRYLLKGYMDKKNRPREVGFLTVLTDQEIIRKFNQFMMGFANYYIRAITYPSRINRWVYINYFACLKTLATKHRMSVKSVIQTYGFKDKSDTTLNWYKPKPSNLRIAVKYHFNNVEKWEVLLNYHELMSKALRLRHAKDDDEIIIPTIDFLTLNKVNFRTRFKSESGCAVCASPSHALHHIKPLKHKGGRYSGYKGFDKIVAALGRKQIPVCKNCHQNIHSGKYDGLSLDDLYDIRMVAPESLLRFSDSPTRPSGQKSSKSKNSSDENKSSEKKSPDVVIDEKARTYFSGSLNNYFKQKTNNNYD